MKYIDQVKETTEFLRTRIQSIPETGIILGTGLGALAKEIDVEISFPYTEIPHFPVSTVESHSGRLIFGKLEGKPIVAMQGRFHYYEGYSMKQVTFPVRVMKFLGIKRLMVSNASGSLNPTHKISDLMFINDQIDLFPESPLTGAHEQEFGARFPDMSEVYDRSMIAEAHKIAKEHNIAVQEGIYVGVKGPNLETPAEYKYLRIIGGDAVGMSTVPEITVACQMGLPVFAISAITDLGVEGKIKKVSLEDVIEAANKAEPGMTKIIRELIARL